MKVEDSGHARKIEGTSGRDGRVGERATIYIATHSPLVEPEVQISRVRLS